MFDFTITSKNNRAHTRMGMNPHATFTKPTESRLVGFVDFVGIARTVYHRAGMGMRQHSSKQNQLPVERA